MSVTRNVIRIDLAERESEAQSIVEQLYEERTALLREIHDMKLVFAMLLTVHGTTVIPHSFMVDFDEKHTDIIEERLPEGFRYSLDHWAPKA